MPPLTLKTIHRDDGVVFKRSDGRTFFMLRQADGSATLHQGAFDAKPSHFGFAELDVSVRDKVGRAIRRVLAYPDQPE